MFRASPNLFQQGPASPLRRGGGLKLPFLLFGNQRLAVEAKAGYDLHILITKVGVTALANQAADAAMQEGSCWGCR